MDRIVEKAEGACCKIHGDGQRTRDSPDRTWQARGRDETPVLRLPHPPRHLFSPSPRPNYPPAPPCRRRYPARPLRPFCPSSSGPAQLPASLPLYKRQPPPPSNPHGSTTCVSASERASTMGPAAARTEDMRALAVRAVTDSLRAASVGCGAAERAARFEECVRGLEAEKAKMEVFRRELPISVRLVADVIEWLKDELAQHHRRPDLFVAPVAAAKRKAAAAAVPGNRGVKPEEEGEDKRSWMSSAQLWSCGSLDDGSRSTGNSDGGVAGGTPAAHAHKVSNDNAFMPVLAGVPPALATRSTDDAEDNNNNNKPAAVAMAPVPDLSLLSPAIDAAPSATSSAVTNAGAAQQRKARRCWSPELHRRFVAALQRLGGAQAATPKQIRELMKVDGLTNDEVKSHLQKYRLHTRRASSDGGDHQQVATALWPSAPEQQQQQYYTTSQHSTSQSGSPQEPLQLTVSSSRAAVSVTGGDSCDSGEEEEEDGKSESYGWEMQQRGTKSSSP